jgi:membrane-bound serine protease (ClpP class)
MIALWIARVSLRTNVALVGAWLACAFAAPAAAQALEQAQPQAAVPVSEAPAGEATVYRIPVTGVVEMGLAPFISRSLREAAASGAALAVLDIDTPGGRVDAAQQISDALSDATIPVYAYVNRRALSAGALIALATNGIYMRPGSTIGAATPVTGEGERASEKIVSAMRSEFRALAEARGLDPRIAEAMVDEEVEIVGLVERGKLLTLSTQDATRMGYAQEASDWDDLMAQLGIEEAQVVVTEVNWAERLVRFFTHPLVAPFLLSFGFLGLLIEVKTPAFGLAGLAGLVSLGLFFGSHLIIGLAGWEVIILLAIGIMLLLVEALILPGFGVAGVLGTVAVGVSIFLSLIGKMPTMFDIMIAMQVLGTAVIIVGVTSWQLLKRLPQEGRAQGLLHRTSMLRELGYSSAALREDLVGLQGVTLTDLRPAGTARFGDERVDVVSSGSWVQAGTPVRVVRAEGYRHIVEPV